MKKALFTFVFIFVSGILCNAQTPLPYYTGFDTPSEMAGWTKFSTGNTTAYPWFMGTTFISRSAPNVIQTSSTEFAAVTDTPVEWYVSPGFNFHTGGKIDSFAINIFQGGGTHFPSDSIVVYLLAGSNNPLLATRKIRLANLTDMVVDNYTFRDTGNFTIPPTPGISYIAFKYYSVNDWFVATIDNLHISGNSIAGITGVNEESLVNVYPNPAQNDILLSCDLTSIQSISLADISGKVVRSYAPCCRKLDVTGIATGNYALSIVTEKETIVRKIMIQN